MSATVLIVDDEPDVARYLTMALRANGYTAVTADSVEHGLEEVHKARPDLICLDIMMPRQSGITMYTQLKNDKTLRSIPVIFISGVGHEDPWDFRSFVPDESIPPPELFLVREGRTNEDRRQKRRPPAPYGYSPCRAV
jgi:response regulator RpfG family c-di-GMP phosphodiesterase